MKKEDQKRKLIIVLLFMLILSNFGLTFAFWSSHVSNGHQISDTSVSIGSWDFEDTALVVSTYKLDYQYVLSLVEETVALADKPEIEEALAAYGALSDEAKNLLLNEKDLLLSLFNEIIALEHSVFLDFEAYAYDQGLTGTVDIDGRTWYGNAVYISNDPSYDVWNDTRSLALKTGAYFESRDYFMNGIDRITIYHGALNYNNGASFAFKIEYELASNPGVWLTVQQGGVDTIISVISGNPLNYSEVLINIVETVNIRFTPVISNTTDYINLDDIRIYEHIVSSSLEVETYRTLYAEALALTDQSVKISDKSMVESALTAYDLLSLDAQNALSIEKNSLDELINIIDVLEDIYNATQAVLYAETTVEQTDLNVAQSRISLLIDGTDKQQLQQRIDVLQIIIDSITLFLATESDVLSLSIETVTLSDKTDVENALDIYDTLSDKAQSKLITEKTLLDQLLTEINQLVPTETLVLEFRTDHALALSFTKDTVQIMDLESVEQALEDYVRLTTDAQTVLSIEKQLLDQLHHQILVLIATDAVLLAETSFEQIDIDAAQVCISVLIDSEDREGLQARLENVQTDLDAFTYFIDIYDALLQLTPETVTVANKSEIEDALATYGFLSDDTKMLLETEHELLIALWTEIISFEQSIWIDFEGYAYDQGLTGTIEIDGRTWYGNAVYISNDPSYDVWNDTRSLALKMGAYFESRDAFINGIDKISLYHGALHYDNGTSFAFKIEYALVSNPNVWLKLQNGGVDVITQVISGTPLSFVEIDVNLTDAVNIRFVPVIGNTSDYINLDDIRIYEHIVSSEFEVERFRVVYENVLALNTESVTLSHKDAVYDALSTYETLTVEAKTGLTAEKIILDELALQISILEDIVKATNAVERAELSLLLLDVDHAQIEINVLPEGIEKQELQQRLDDVMMIINEIDAFLFDIANVLLLTPETVLSSDKPALEQAILAYLLLSVEAKQMLLDEKASLDLLLITLNEQTPLEDLVLAYQTEHSYILSITTTSVSILDRMLIEEALYAYNLLTVDAQSELLQEKILLDQLMIQVFVLEATEAVEFAETTIDQDDVNHARLLVNALVDGVDKQALISRVDTLQGMIDLQRANDVDQLILALPVTGELELTDELDVVFAREAYLQLTISQQLLVQHENILSLLENELTAVRLATELVGIAEVSLIQIDHDVAIASVNLLVNGFVKTNLLTRLSSVQDIIDVVQAQSVMLTYFSSNTVVVSRLTNNTIKQNAFIAKANEVVGSYNVIVLVINSTYVDRNNSIYTVSVTKNGYSVTFDVSVDFVR